MSENMRKILEIIKQVKPSIDELREDTILNTGVLDSLDIITIIELMEKEFKIDIAGTCLKQENFETPETLLKMIEQLI